MTPSRSELAKLIERVWNDTSASQMQYVAADVVLPLLEAKDARIAELEALVAAELTHEAEKLGLYGKVKRLEDGWEAEVARLVAERDEARRIADQLAEAPMWGTWYQPGVTNAARKAWEGRSWREAAPRSRT